jgi:hypothetical protein
VELNAFELAVKWLNDNPGTRVFLILILGILFTFIYFRLTGGTGFVLYVTIVGVVWFCGLLNIPQLLLPALVLVPLLGVGNEMLLRARKKRATSYLPAVAEVEGGGIKRGLTAPEAAVILELPLSKVLTLVIFGLLRKGVLRQVEADPLTVEVEEDYRASTRDSTKQRESRRLKAAARHQTVLHIYEHGFLALIEQNPDKPLNEIDFSTPMKNLITHAAQRLKGFDLSDTQDYYQRIIQRALDEARSIGDVEQRGQALDRNLEWILMNDRDRYEDAFDWQDRSNQRHSYRPLWVRRSSGHYGTRFVPVPVPASSAPGGDTPSYGGTTSFGDVAASFAGWTENTFGEMASAISPGALQVNTPGGVIDLSGADKGFFKALSESASSGGGGGGGGCACACAGCACACACAGGGR